MSKDNESEVWAYDEPHESGGSAHVTMTKRQAIEWMRHIYGPIYAGDDDRAFQDWVDVHYAYKTKAREMPHD